MNVSRDQSCDTSFSVKGSFCETVTYERELRNEKLF